MTNDTDPTTPPVAAIPEAAVEAAWDAFAWRPEPAINTGDPMRDALAAALPHLTPGATTKPLNDLQNEIGAWAESTFDHTDAGIVTHLHEEHGELMSAFRSGEDVRAEAADCLILLLALAHRQGWSLLEAVKAKHAINAARQWGTPNEDGIVHHAGREEAPPPAPTPDPVPVVIEQPTLAMAKAGAAVMAEIRRSRAHFVTNDIGDVFAIMTAALAAAPPPPADTQGAAGLDEVAIALVEGVDTIISLKREASADEPFRCGWDAQLGSENDNWYGDHPYAWGDTIEAAVLALRDAVRASRAEGNQ